MYRNKMNKDIHFNSLLSISMMIVFFVVLALSFTFYYDLNDDVLIKDIVSGAYSGTPSAHSIQMLYPISWLISILYKIIPVLPWYGLFLCGCQGISFYLIMERSLSFIEDKTKKVLLAAVEIFLILTLCAWEFVIVQYTVTSALLSAAACFLVFTQKSDEQEAENRLAIGASDLKQNRVIRFLRQNRVAIILVILAFNIRSEMLLLMCPFIALTGIVKWSGEKAIFEKETVKKYLGLIGVILIGMGLSLVIDIIAYSGKDWKEFRNFFDARTQVYDYTWYPAYEEAKEFYHEIGASKAQVTLIDNYNFGLDESVDSDMLWDIAEYAESTGVKTPLVQRLKEAIADYKWRTFHVQDAPYNYVVLAAYAMVLVLAVLNKDKTAIWKLPLMGIFRTIPWMYVILSKRVPARISHPLYFIELIILCAWIFSYLDRKIYPEKGSLRNTADSVSAAVEKKYIVCPHMFAIFAIFFMVYAMIWIPTMWNNLKTEMVRRESVNEVMQRFDTYAEEHPDNYYYMDVYSAVDFSEKMFSDVDNSQKNYDILGGWASGSPLQKQATADYHKDMLSRAELLLQDNFYFVAEEDSDITFLEEFYGTQGIEIVIEPVDEISGKSKTLVVYKVTGMIMSMP